MPVAVRQVARQGECGIAVVRAASTWGIHPMRPGARKQWQGSTNASPHTGQRTTWFRV
jgi:hypothetical protein